MIAVTAWSASGRMEIYEEDMYGLTMTENWGRFHWDIERVKITVYARRGVG